MKQFYAVVKDTFNS